MEDVLVFLDANADIPLIVIHARWPLSVEGTRYAVDGDSGVDLKWSGGADERPDENDNAAIFEAGLRASMLRLTQEQRSVVLLGPTPEINYHVPLTTARAKMLGFNFVPAFNFDLHQQRSTRAEEILRRVAHDIKGVEYLPVADVICSEELCRVVSEEGLPYYIDDDHLSNEASKILLADRLNQLWRLAK